MESSRNKPQGVHEQRNKGHKKLSAKLMKRREGERNRKKDKKSKDKKRDKKENRTARLNKYVSKLYRFCEGDTSEILELFGQLDEGVMVGISDMESEVLQKLLKKIFKLLEVGKNPEKEYFKPEGYECIKLKMEKLFKRAATKGADKEDKLGKRGASSVDGHGAKEDSDQESGSEDEGNEGDDGDSSESDHQGIRKGSDDASSDIDGKPEPVASKKQQRSQLEPVSHKRASASQKAVYGPPRPVETSGSNTDRHISPSSLLQSGLQSQGDDLFSAVLNRTSDYRNEHRDKLRQGLLKNPQDLIELPEEEMAKAEKARKTVEEYDKLHRPKTLLEIHQEAKKQNTRKGEIVNDGPELFSLGGVSRIDSKKVFTMLSNAGSGLSNRFSDGVDTNHSVNKLKQNFI